VLGADGRPKANVGRLKAEIAAAAVGGVTLIPPFEPNQLGSDWNDLARISGETFKPTLKGALAAAEQRLVTPGLSRDDLVQHQTSRPSNVSR
jgi:putative DNA primase/helicase